MNRTLQRATTGRSIVIMIRGSATTPAGMALTGLLFNTAGLVIRYTRLDPEGQPLAAPVAITLATLASVTAAWSSGGFIELDGTNAKGLYRLDLPDAAIGSGAHAVVVSWQGANSVEDACLIELPDYDALSAPAATIDANLTQVNGVAVPSAAGRLEANTTHLAGTAVDATGGLINANVKQISGDAAAADNLEAAADGTGYNLGGGQVVAASVTGAVASVTGNVGGNVSGSVSSVTGNVGGNVVGSVGSVAGNVNGNVNGSVGSVTGNVGGSVASVTSLAAGAISAASFAAAALAAIADKFLGRSIAGGADGGRTVTSFFRKGRNKVVLAAGTGTVYQEDDATVDHTFAYVGTPAVTSVDP